MLFLKLIIFQSLFGSIHQRLQQNASCALRADCLETIRILSREKGFLDSLLTDSFLAVLVAQARLKPCSEDDSDQNIEVETIPLAEGETKGELFEKLTRVFT